MQSSQVMNSSSNCIPQIPQYSENQTFPVVYNNNLYMVDPNCLLNSSRKFKEMIEPFMKLDNKISDLHLTIVGNSFSTRSIKNFLQLCQNLPSDVQNSEMKEVCEIAKMFQADQIYNTGISFIKSNIDPNFDVPDNKYDRSDGKSYLMVEGATNIIHHAGDMNELSFSDDELPSSDEPKEISEQKHPSQPIKKPKVKSIIYEIVCKHRAMALPEFKFVSLGQLMFTAKKKENNIYIGKNDNIHISKPDTQIAQIIQNEDKTNIVHFHSLTIDFGMKYVESGRPNHISIEATFTNSNNKEISWSPMTPKYNADTNKYYLNFNGEYHHTPITSKKNIVLQNKKGKPTFIVRKMGMYNYEVECLPTIDPLIVFVIALADIVGPYNDPLAEVDF